MKHSRSSLLLMEIIIAILFFSFASAVCMQIFVKAKNINEQSIQHEEAMRIAQQIIELYKNDQLTSDQLLFDEFGQPISTQNAYYHADISKAEDTIKIEVCCDDQILYSTTYFHYQQRKME